MKPSLFNIELPLGKDRILLVNTLSGAVDVVQKAAGRILRGDSPSRLKHLNAHLSERRYLVEDKIDEIAMLEQIYPELLRHVREASPLRCMLLLTFDCNLRCGYCWQARAAGGRPAPSSPAITRPMVRRAIRAIELLQERLNTKGRPVVQLFGGEPLLPSNRAVVVETLKRCSAREWAVHVTTNGVYLSDFLDAFVRYSVQEVQVTIDGPRKIHEQRRRGSHFDGLMDGMERLIQQGGTKVKLRVNVDFSNLRGLPELADEIIGRQWYASRDFYAYIAPLRDAIPGTRLLRRRAALLADLLELFGTCAKLEVFDLLGWDGHQPVRHFVQTGSFPMSRVHICDANLNQIVFGPLGHIHLCGEVAHDPKAAVGAFSPSFRLDEAAFDAWYRRGPLDSNLCRRCSFLPVCAGGCQLIPEAGETRDIFCAQVRACFEESLVRAYRKGELA